MSSNDQNHLDVMINQKQLKNKDLIYGFFQT